jgi:hypothetical protein
MLAAGAIARTKQLKANTERMLATATCVRAGHWFSYVFLVDQLDLSSRTVAWTVGGFQGGEGADGAAEWNVENILDELDYPNEWYFDAAASDLYYYHNVSGSGPPPPTLQFAVSHTFLQRDTFLLRHTFLQRHALSRLPAPVSLFSHSVLHKLAQAIYSRGYGRKQATAPTSCA